MSENIDDSNNRWLGMVHGHWAGAVADEADSDLLLSADVVIDLSSDDEPLDHYSDGTPSQVLRLADGSHCAFAIRFDGNGNAAVENGRRQARIVGANDDELVHLAHGGGVRSISAYTFYPDLGELAVRAKGLANEARAMGYAPAGELKTGSVRDLTAGLAAIRDFAAAQIESGADENIDQALSLITSLQDLAGDMVAARRRETVRELLIEDLKKMAAAAPPLIVPKSAKILEANILRQGSAAAPPDSRSAPPPPAP